MHTPLSEVHLILYMTPGMSLAKWDKHGMLEREIALYKAVRPHLKKISIVSYGGKEEAAYAKQHPEFNIIFNRLEIPGRYYATYIARVLPRFYQKPTIIKTNQMKGADIALAAARTAKATFIARCGFLRSVHATQVFGADSLEARRAVALEQTVFSAADLSVVTSEHMLKTVQKQASGTPNVMVVPNYIVERWFPEKDIAKRVVNVCFIGRFEEQKNILNMLRALASLDISITLIGQGSLLPQAKKLAQDLQLEATFIDRLPHRELIKEMSRADVYLQPSLYEGHPKTILEAMALGLPVIAGDSPGIANFMKHEITGYLCGITSEAIRSALDTVLNSHTLRQRLGHNARQYALGTVGLETTVTALELNAYQQAIAAHNS